MNDPGEQSMLLGSLVGLSAGTVAVAGLLVWFLRWLRT